MDDFTRDHLTAYRQDCDAVLFDICKKNWSPLPDELDNFCKSLYRDIVANFRGYEKTQEYESYGEVLVAENAEKILAWTVGGGLTKSETCATHSMGWEIARLGKSYREDPQPFSLTLLIVGYKPGRTDTAPVNDLNRMLGITNETKH